MKKGRIVVELPEYEKIQLERELKKRGQTISSWVAENVHEIVEPSLSDGDIDISNIEDKNVIQILKDLDWAFTDAKTMGYTHAIHPYPAKFIPQIPRTLIKTLSNPGDVVWDPFGGSGTTAFEALSLSRRAVSTDINPIANLVGVTKTLSIGVDEDRELQKIIGELSILISSGSFKKRLLSLKKEVQAHVPQIPNIQKWFHEYAITELAYIRLMTDSIENEKVRTIARAAFSKIILRSSFQDGETRYASKPRTVKEGEVLSYFTNELESMRKKLVRNADVLRFRNAEFKTWDLRSESDCLDRNSVDLVVTSPPYPNSTDYHLYHRFRLFWLGHSPKDIADGEIGSHLRAQREKTGIDQYLAEMETCLKKIYDTLRHGKYAVLVVGSGVFEGVEYDSADPLSERARRIGYEVVANIGRVVHASKRSFAAPARRLKEEKVLILRKPDKLIELNLIPAPYKVAPYEEKISQLEINTLTPTKTKGTKKLFANSAELAGLKKLTFIHGVHSSECSKERTWQAILENGDAFEVKSNRKDPKYATHGLHEYKGKFYPQLAKSLFNLAGLKEGYKVLDPFCGSGTVLLESYLNGFTASGVDLNPLALKIARNKTDLLQVSPYTFECSVDEFIRDLNSISTEGVRNLAGKYDSRVYSELQSWFATPVLSKLDDILTLIARVNHPVIRDFLEICLSSVVRSVSHQEPKDLRIRRRKVELEDAPVKELFLKKVLDQKKRVFKFWSHSNMNPALLGRANATEGDSRKPGDLQSLNNGELFDAVVTSPPYATALPYIDTDRLSILLLFGLKSKERQQVEDALIGAREISSAERSVFEKSIERKDFSNIKSRTARATLSQVHALNTATEVGFRRKNMAALLYRYYSDMTKVMENVDSVLKPGGSAFFVIGNNKTLAGETEMIIDSDKFLCEVGKNLGWSLNMNIPITVTQENRLHNKNSIKENNIIWFKKS